MIGGVIGEVCGVVIGVVCGVVCGVVSGVVIGGGDWGAIGACELSWRTHGRLASGENSGSG